MASMNWLISRTRKSRLRQHATMEGTNEGWSSAGGRSLMRPTLNAPATSSAMKTTAIAM